jgi:hypothetical protein
LAKKLAIIVGSSMIDIAKISGIIPAELTLSGMCVLWPPYIRVPRMRFAYCTGMRRWASCTITMRRP